MIFQWVSVLGVTGFLCGFIGPMLLAPDANQGPMLGIFITGPAGAIVGAALGGLAALLGWDRARSKPVLYACACIVAVVSLYFSIPSPRYHADAVEGDIRSCSTLESLRDKTIDSLDRIEAQRPRPSHIAWREKFDQAAADNAGVVLAVHVTRMARTFEKQARWNRGDITMKPWAPVEQDISYFAAYAGADCAKYPDGTHVQLAATGNLGIWPPYGIAEMLNVKRAEPLSLHYAQLASAAPSR